MPTVAGTQVSVELRVVGGPIDAYLMDREWADRLADGGTLNLTQPFNYDAANSRIRLNGSAELSLTSDGRTEHMLVLDNSDTYYAGDATPNLSSPTNGTASSASSPVESETSSSPPGGCSHRFYTVLPATPCGA